MANSKVGCNYRGADMSLVATVEGVVKSGEAGLPTYFRGIALEIDLALKMAMVLIPSSNCSISNRLV